MNEVTLTDPSLRDEGYAEEETPPLPRVLKLMDPEQVERFRLLVEKKAWIKATEIQDFTDREKEKIAEVEEERGPKLAKKVRERLYLRYHWDALRWFLFGGLVDIPVQQNPKKAWDPITNPFLKVKQRGFVWTQDEHDQATPYKRLPDKDYLRLVSYAWVHDPLLAIPKSRQLMMTWLFCAVGVHETLFREAKTTAWISKKFDDANAHLKNRVKGIADRLPAHLNPPEYNHIKGIFECDATNSIIRAMGEEAKGLRQYTFSWIFDDEAAFQDQSSDIIQAALPSVKGGGRFTLVSSANGEDVFYQVVSENGRIPVPAGA